MEVVGFIGAALLAMCALPQAIMSAQQGHSKGLSLMFLWTWYIGEIMLLYFTAHTLSLTSPLFLNYLVNTILLTVIVYYRHFPRRNVG